MLILVKNILKHAGLEKLFNGRVLAYHEGPGLILSTTKTYACRLKMVANIG